jgi:small subunit ribosomal protein S17
MKGRVVSNKMKNTVTVLIDSTKKHPLYKKSFAWSKKYLVDDPIGASLGDIVEIVKVRPVSKNKHFRVIKIVGRDEVALGEEHMQTVVEQAIAEVIPEEVEEVAAEVEVADEGVKEEKPKAEKKAKKVEKKPRKETKS